VALLELAHVYAHHRRLFPEERFGQRTRQLGLPNTRRPEKEEAAYRTVGVREPCPGPPYSLGNRIDGLLLSDDALVELLLQPEQTLALLFGELADLYPGRPRDDLGNVFGRYLGDGLASSLEGPQPVLQLLDPALEVLGLLKIFGGDGLVLLALETPYILLETPWCPAAWSWSAT
jgi:hypothetical protein